MDQSVAFLNLGWPVLDLAAALVFTSVS